VVLFFIISLHPLLFELPAQGALNYPEAQESVVLLRRIVKDSPRFTIASMNLAKALLYSGRREEALSVLEKASLTRQHRVLSRLFLTQETAKIYQEGLSLIHRNFFRQGRVVLLRALEREPDNVEILLRMGQCLVLEEDPDSAVEKLYVAKKLAPFEPEVSLWLGRALQKRGELKKAFSELQTAHRALRGSELAPLWYSEVLNAFNQRAEALKLLDEDIKEHPLHLNVLLYSAVLKFQHFHKKPSVFGSIRRDLQLILSQLNHYGTPKNPKFEGELGLDLRDKDFVQTESNALLMRISSNQEALQ
jgi:tetratricopeptide (TPR) repeat protein